MAKTPEQINRILKELVKSLDITPTEYQRAVKSYESISSWLLDGLEDGYYPQCQDEPVIYPQGSINLGTIVKPFRDGKVASYDIDLVCELKNKLSMVPKDVKNQVGDRIKAHAVYNEKLDKEGKRCWTIEYSQNSDISFHIDILPAISENKLSNIKITDLNLENKTYDWKSSNPKGFAEWFRIKNTTFKAFMESQRKELFEHVFAEDGTKKLFESVQEVPEQLVRTPLQRVIQLLKRHRDVFFKNDPKYKPISMIITTLSAEAYNGETDIYTALNNIITTLSRHSTLMSKMYFDESVAMGKSIFELISKGKNENGETIWKILNPVNNEENFADKWHEDGNKRARAFFNWLDEIKKDIEILKNANEVKDIERLFKKSFSLDLTEEIKEYLSPKTNNIPFPNVIINKPTQPWREI